ncbi:MAG: GNAT family N-acetyltransferase [Ancrocorticia sp.]
MDRHRLLMRRSLTPGQGIADFSQVPVAGAVVVPIDQVDITELAELMLAAYRGTPDDEGEDLDDAIAVVRDAVAGEHGPLSSSASGAICIDDDVASAIFVSGRAEIPLISYVITAPNRQRQGLATFLIERACAALAGQGYGAVELAVTVGAPGERLYRRLGFQVIESWEE